MIKAEMDAKDPRKWVFAFVVNAAIFAMNAYIWLGQGATSAWVSMPAVVVSGGIVVYNAVKYVHARRDCKELEEELTLACLIHSDRSLQQSLDKQETPVITLDDGGLKFG